MLETNQAMMTNFDCDGLKRGKRINIVR